MPSPQTLSQSLLLKAKLRHILTQRQADDAWLECLSLRQEANRLYVGFPHRYYGDWFHLQKKQLFEEILAVHFGADSVPVLLYECQTQKCKLPPSPPPGQPVMSPPAEEQRASVFVRAGQPEGDAFATFLVNQHNAFPKAAAQNIAEQSAAENCIPFFVCGRSGTGKSHLLHAMATTLERHHSRVIYAGTTHFCAEHPCWRLRPDMFWHQCDALLLDDVQELMDHPAWQQKLVACLDACPRDTQHVVVFACLGSIQTLKSFDERLRSRCESGLVVELREPDLDVRMRYLQQQNETRRLAMDHGQLLRIAQSCAQFHRLQGILRKITAFCSVKEGTLTQNDLENILRTSASDTAPGCLEILGEVAHALDVRPQDVLGNRRHPTLVRARQLAMYLCRRKLGLSYPELGRAFGGKDHSTVIHAVKKIENLLTSDKSVQEFIAHFERQTA